MIFLLCVYCSLSTSNIGCGDSSPVESGWQYVVPAAGAKDEHSPARAIKVSERVEERPDFQTKPVSKEIRFGQVIYGTANSTPVSVAVESISPEKALLYVDADRDMRFDDTERHPLALSADGQSGPIRIAIDAYVFHSKNEPPERTPRTVVFWVGRAGKSVRYATVGYLAGTTKIENRAVAVRRFDMNGDGFVNGANDILARDLDGNGDFDPYLERFAVAPILRLASKRYSISSDANGANVKFTRLEAEGSLQCLGPKLQTGARIVELSISLVGEDGVALFLTEFSKPAIVPVGKYRVYQLAMTIVDAEGGEPWYYQFSPEYGAKQFAWHAVGQNTLTSLDPLAGLKLSAKLNDPPKLRSQPGQSLSLLTSFQSADLLEAQICCRGTHFDNLKSSEAKLGLACEGGEQLDSASTGFS